MEKTCITFWKAEATSCACCTPDKRMSLRNDVDCEPRPTNWMRPPSLGSCGVGDARAGYVPTELIATDRELVRLHTSLADEVARYKNEIQARLSVVFPEFSQVFANPCRSTAVALLKLYRSRSSRGGSWSRDDCGQAP
jgi:hypothetical protein